MSETGGKEGREGEGGERGGREGREGGGRGRGGREEGGRGGERGVLKEFSVDTATISDNLELLYTKLFDSTSLTTAITLTMAIIRPTNLK